MCIDEEKENEQGKETKMSKEEYARAVRSLRDKISSLTIALFDCLERLEYLEIERGMSSGFDSNCDFMGAIKASSESLDCLIEAIYRKYGDDDYEIIDDEDKDKSNNWACQRGHRMKAKDLIAELLKFSPDTEVCALTASLELSSMLWLGDNPKENGEHEIQIIGMAEMPCLYYDVNLSDNK